MVLPHRTTDPSYTLLAHTAQTQSHHDSPRYSTDSRTDMVKPSYLVERQVDAGTCQSIQRPLMHKSGPAGVGGYN